MYWICFGDSAKGMLACLHHSYAPEITRDHILCFYDDLSQGSIADVTDRVNREAILAPWRDAEPDSGEWIDKMLVQHFDESLPLLGTVDEAVIWCGDNAREQCGMRYILSCLHQRNIPVWLIEVNDIPCKEIKADSPDGVIGSAVGVIVSTKKGKQIPIPRVLAPLLHRHLRRKRAERLKAAAARGEHVRYWSSGEMDPEAAAYFYQRRRRLDQQEQAAFAAEWTELQAQNAPLRAMQDGKVISVPADYYDAIILSCIPDEQAFAALAVGKSLIEIRQKTGNTAGDMQVFKRIQALAAQGRIQVVHNAASYRGMIIKAV